MTTDNGPLTTDGPSTTDCVCCRKDDNPGRINGIAGTLFFILLMIDIALMIYQIINSVPWMIVVVSDILIFLAAMYILLGLKIANQWEKAVVLRLGKFQNLRGPGLFWIIPIIDTITEWIDHRVMVSPFSAEKTLTKDTVPVDVDAVLFWLVWDAEKAALEVEDYRAAISWAAQTALREVIGAVCAAQLIAAR